MSREKSAWCKNCNMQVASPLYHVMESSDDRCINVTVSEKRVVPSARSTRHIAKAGVCKFCNKRVEDFQTHCKYFHYGIDFDHALLCHFTCASFSVPVYDGSRTGCIYDCESKWSTLWQNSLAYNVRDIYKGFDQLETKTIVIVTQSVNEWKTVKRCSKQYQANNTFVVKRKLESRAFVPCALVFSKFRVYSELRKVFNRDISSLVMTFLEKVNNNPPEPSTSGLPSCHENENQFCDGCSDSSNLHLLDHHGMLLCDDCHSSLMY